MVELRAPPARAYDLGDLRLRWQRADRDLPLRFAADVAGAASRSTQSMVRAAWIQSLLRARCHRLHDGHHAVEGVRRTGMVCRLLARGRVGGVFHYLPAHAGTAEGAAYLRCQLVLYGLHPGRGGFAY